jgi:hypothetical protein
MSHDATSEARSIEAAGWTKQGEAMCTDNPHPVLLFRHIVRNNSKLI